jgi:hypothetical protein
MVWVEVELKGNPACPAEQGEHTAQEMLPNGNIPPIPSSKARHAGRHQTKNRYPPEQASGTGKHATLSDHLSHQA